MAQCFDRITLERYVLNSVADEKRVAQIHAHTQRCASCMDFVTELKAYYQETDRVAPETVDSVAARLKNRIGLQSGDYRILLQPIDVQKTGISKYRLAADSGVTPRYLNIQSCINTDEDMVARIMKDTQSGEMCVYLLYEGEDRFQNCILELEHIERQYPVEADNTVKLDDLDEDGVEGKSITIKSPLATFDLTPLLPLKEKIVTSGSFSIKSDAYDQIRIEASEEKGHTSYKISIMNLKAAAPDRKVHVVVSQRDQTLTAPADHGVAVFEDLDLEKILNIRIY